MDKFNIDDLMRVPVQGNAYGDHDLWQQLYAVALSRSQPIADRARAIRRMDDLTGCDESAGKDDDAALVAEFVEGMLRDCGVEETD